MSRETPPSFAALKFNAIGKRSLRDRLSAPDPQVQTAPVGEEQEEDDLYVDMDIDVEIHPPGDESRLSARLGGLPPDHSPIAAQDAQLPTSGSDVVSLAARGQRTDPTLCTTTPDTSLSNSRDNASIHINPIAAQHTLTFQGLPTPPPSGASAPLYTNEQFLLPNSHISPTPTTDAPFSPFPYTPLNELLQEERDAWGEVWKAKLIRVDSSFTSVHATDLLLSLPGRSQIETSASDSLVVTSDMPSSSTNEISVPSDPPIRDLTRKENDNGKMELTPLSISHDRHPSMGKKVDGSTSLSEPSRLPVASAISPAIERDSLSHPATLQTSRSDSINTGKRHQTPDLDKNDVRVDQQATARAHSVDVSSPREHELKAVLKARKSSNGPKDITNTNQRHTSSESSQSYRQTQEVRRAGFVDGGSGQFGSGTTPSCLPADHIRPTSKAKEDAPYDQRVLEAQVHNLGASNFSPDFRFQNTASTIPYQRRASILQPSRSIEGDNTMRASKRQVKKSETSLKTAMDGASGLTIRSIAKPERIPSFPAKPTFDFVSQKPTLSGSSRQPRMDSSATNFKRSRSPGIKAEPADDGGPVHEPSSRPVKRTKEEHAVPGAWIKKEETEENISETSTLGDPTSIQDTQTVPQETNTRYPGDEYSTGDSLLDQQSCVRGVSTLQPLATASQGHSEADLPPRTGAPPPRVVLTQQERIPRDEVTGRIPGLGTVMDSSSSNIGRGDHDTLDSEMCTGTSEQDPGPPIGNSAGLFQCPTDLSGRRNFLYSETKRQQPQSQSEQTARTQSHSSQPVSAGSAPPNEDWARRPDIIGHRSHVDTSVSDNCRRTRTSGGSPQSRGRSRESRPVLVDHWSPPRPATTIRPRTGNIVVDTYIPSRSPSPARGFERAVDGYRRQYDRGRTPPRNFWRFRRRSSSRGRVLAPPRRSRSPIPRGPARYSNYSRSPSPRRYIRNPSPQPRPFPRRRSPINATQSARSQYANSPKSGGFSTTRDILTPERRLSPRIDAKGNTAVPSSTGLDTISESRSPANHGAAYNQDFPMDDACRSTVVEEVPGPNPREQARVNTPVNIVSTQGQFVPRLTSASPIGRVEHFNIVDDAGGSHNAVHNASVVSQDADNVHHAVRGQQAVTRPQLHGGGRYDHVTPGIETCSLSAVQRVDLAQLTSSPSVVPIQNTAFTSSAQDLTSNLSDTAAESLLVDPHSQQIALAGLPQYRYVDPIDSFNVAGTKEDDDDGPDERTQGKDDCQGEQNHANTRSPSDSTQPPRFNVPNGQGTRGSSPLVNERSPVDYHLSTPSPTRKKTKNSRHQHGTQVQLSTPGKKAGKNHAQTENSVRPENSNVRSLAARIGSEQNNSSPTPEFRDHTTPDAPKLSTSHAPSPASRPSLASRLTTTSTTHERLQLGDRIAANPISSSNTNSLMARFNDPPPPPALAASLPVKPASNRPGDRPIPPRPSSPSLLGRMRSPGQGRETERHWEPHHPVDRDVVGHGRGRGRGRAQNGPQGSHSSSKPSLEDRFSRL